MPDAYGNPLPGEILSPEETNVTSLPQSGATGARPAIPRLADLMRAPSKAVKSVQDKLPFPLSFAMGALPIVQGFNAQAATADAGEALGERAAAVANPFGAALLSALEGAPNTTAGLTAMDKVAAGRGAKKPTAPAKPAAKTDEAAAPAAAPAARVRAPALPQTMFSDINAGLAATAQFVAERGVAREQARSDIAAGNQRAAMARALAPKTEFEQDPVTGQISGVAVYNPATGFGAKRPLRTVVSDQEKAAYMAEADAKYRGGANIDDINNSLKRVGLTYAPAK